MPWVDLVKHAMTSTDNSRSAPQPSQTKSVWDFPTRTFHWLLAISLCGSWFTAEAGFDWTEWHFYFGYFTLGLLVFRLGWGLVGTTSALFRHWPIGLKSLFQYGKQLFTKHHSDYAGHTPLGSLAIIAMLAVVATQAISGLFISDDILYAGPYNPVVSNSLAGELAGLHHTNFIVLQVLVGLHLLAVFWYLFWKKQNLVWPMIVGIKLADSYPLRFFILVFLAIAGIYLLVSLAPPPPVPDYF